MYQLTPEEQTIVDQIFADYYSGKKCLGQVTDNCQTYNNFWTAPFDIRKGLRMTVRIFSPSTPNGLSEYNYWFNY